jgi:neutral ceramidase
MPLYAGVCETNITPPPGVWMCGYAFRPTGSVGVHDELHARAVVFDNGETTVALLAMDLIGLDFDIVRQVREGIAKQTGIAPEAVMLNATHTHGGPNVATLNTMGERDPAYMDILTRKLIGITQQASGNMQPASLAYGRAPVQIGVNRRQTNRAKGQTIIGHNYAGPVAPYVDVLTVRDSRGIPFALLFCHACHGTTLGGDNLLTTADFCGYACDYIRGETGGEVMPFFLQGCAANINPMPRGTFERAAQHGRTLGAAAMEALDNSAPVAGETLDFAEKTVNLPLLPPPPLAGCEQNVREWEAKLEEERAGGHQGRILHAEGMLHYAEYERDIAAQADPVLQKPFALQRLTVGGAQFLGLPGEVFVQYGLDFAKQAETPVFPLAYTNGVHGYVPTAADYPFGGYEVSIANRYYGTLMFTADCERLIRQAAYDLLGIRQPDRTPYSV